MSLLETNITLKSTQCIRGESVFFEITVRNLTKETLNIPPLDHAITLIIESPDGKQRGGPNSAEHRDGIHTHGVHDEVTIEIAKGGELKITGDILEWVGELSAGSYEVRAVYTGLPESVSSKPHKLTVHRVRPIELTTPRPGMIMRDAPRVGAFVHRDDAGAFLAMYQRMSANLPRNATKGIRITQLPEATIVHAATLATARIDKTHVVWQDRRGALHMASSTITQSSLQRPVPLQTRVSGTMLDSPLATSDGFVWLPILESTGKRVVVLQIHDSGAVREWSLTLDGAMSVASYACFWEYEARLSLFFAAERGREVFRATLPLDEPQSGFMAKPIYTADNAIMWVDGFLDLDAQFKEAPMFVQQLPDQEEPEELPEPIDPRRLIFVATEKRGRVQVKRITLPDGKETNIGAFDWSQLQQPKIIHSALTHRGDWALLIVDAAQKLHYYSTMRNQLVVLDKIVGRAITPAQRPRLTTAGEFALEPWVHLRYIAHTGDHVAYHRLDPADHEDPVERKANKPTRKKASSPYSPSR